MMDRHNLKEKEKTTHYAGIMKSIVLLKAGTHKADFKEQAVTKANGRIGPKI